MNNLNRESSVAHRNSTIDLAKCIAAFMVIALHTMRTFGTDSNYGFFIINVVCRMAVPFFAICTGYFLGETYEQAEGDRRKKILASVVKQLKKLIILYCIWSLIYMIYSIPMWVSMGWFSAHAFLDYCIGAVKLGSHYHLWYILSLIYALPIYYLCETHLRKKQLLYLSIALWLVKAVNYGYKVFLPEPVTQVFGIMDKFPGFTDAIFCILPLLILGTLIREGRKGKTEFYAFGFVFSFLLLCSEAFLLKSRGQLAASYIFSTYPTAYFLFQLILCTHIPISQNLSMKMSSISLLVYCIHPMFGEITDALLTSNTLHYLVTAVASAGVSLLFLKIVQHRNA